MRKEVLTKLLCWSVQLQSPDLGRTHAIKIYRPTYRAFHLKDKRLLLYLPLLAATPKHVETGVSLESLPDMGGGKHIKMWSFFSRFWLIERENFLDANTKRSYLIKVSRTDACGLTTKRFWDIKHIFFLSLNICILGEHQIAVGSPPKLPFSTNTLSCLKTQETV